LSEISGFFVCRADLMPPPFFAANVAWIDSPGFSFCY
jgi:hypothetical protein